MALWQSSTPSSQVSDHDTGSAVDEERAPDLRAGVDVDTGATVRHLGHGTSDDRFSQLVEDLGDPTCVGQRLPAGLADCVALLPLGLEPFRNGFERSGHEGFLR